MNQLTLKWNIDINLAQEMSVFDMNESKKKSVVYDKQSSSKLCITKG